MLCFQHPGSMLQIIAPLDELVVSNSFNLSSPNAVEASFLTLVIPLLDYLQDKSSLAHPTSSLFL